MLCLDDTVLCFDDIVLCFDHTVLCFHNIVLCLNDTVLCFHDIVLCFHNIVLCFDNTMLCFDNSLLCSDNTVLCFDNSLLCFDNTVLCLEKCLLCLQIWATVDYPASRVSFDLPKRLCSQGTIRSDMARISLFSFWCADYDVEFLQGKNIQNKTTQFQCAPMKHHISRKHFSPLLVQVFHG